MRSRNYKILFFAVILLVTMNFSGLAHVTLVYPTGGETFRPGEKISITWDEDLPHNTLNWDLFFSADGGETWNAIQLDIPYKDLNHTWTVPDKLTGSGRIKVVQDNEGVDYQDESNDFSISTTLPLKAEAGEHLYICAGDTSAFFLGGDPSAAGGKGPFRYAWATEYNAGSTLFSASDFLSDTTIANPEIINAALPDSVMFYLHIRDANDSLAIDSVFVKVSGFQFCLMDCLHEIMEGDSVKIGVCVSGGIPPLSYAWSPLSTLSDSTVSNPWAKPGEYTVYNLTITDSVGCKAYSGCTVMVQPTDIKEHMTPAVKVYPNPAQTQITIIRDENYSKDVGFEMYNAKGKLILQSDLEKSHVTLDVSELQKGIYYYRLRTKTQSLNAGTLILH